MQDLANRTRYAITHVDQDGSRVLTLANQGRNHFDTREAADAHLAAMLANNRPANLANLTGSEAATATLEVRPVECYHHGDAVGVYFPDEYALFGRTLFRNGLPLLTFAPHVGPDNERAFAAWHTDDTARRIVELLNGAA